ncbi:sulfite exporter TauE/SafE family protein [Roseivirga sp.]|uniref:sulfite exporter TauE/SafE family protein n=1 Tax=Roseivirga sp. TaxID=1964215 RepID=UPI003B5234F8
MLLLWTGFLFGLFGSMHCLGMCAPLIWALPQQKEKRLAWWSNRLAYNFGRAITYAFLGVIIGLIGETISLAGFQQYLSIATGVLMIVFLVTTRGRIPQSFAFKPLNQLILKVKKSLGKLIQGNTFRSNAMLGLYNGLLPCGLVYMALIASLSMSSLGGSALYMVFFGLGTFPMMLAAALFGHRIRNWNQKVFTQWVPRFIFLVAILLIFRGLNLGIPYLSPRLVSNNDIVLCETP